MKIRPKMDANTQILDLSVGEQYRDKFKDIDWLLNELVVYGADLIPRLATEPKQRRRPFDVVDLVLIGLLRHLLAMIDAVRVLLREGAAYGATPSVRSLTEGAINLSWILKADTENRARAYYVANLRLRRHAALRTIPGTPEYNELLASLNAIAPEEDHVATLSRIEDAARGELKQINSKIAQVADLAAMDAAFKKARKSATFDPNWHKVAGARSIREMAIEVGRLDEYENYYSPSSRTIHGASQDANVRIIDGGVAVTNIRDPSQIVQTVRMTVTVTRRAYRELLGHYRPEEVDRFTQKYKDEWREVFLPLLNAPLE